MIALWFRKFFYGCLLRLLGVSRLYREVVVEDRHQDVEPEIRGEIVDLLTKVNENNPYFRGKYTDFLKAVKGKSDEVFFEEYAKLPAMTKDDYAEGGFDVMNEEYKDRVEELMFEFSSSPIKVIKQLWSKDFIFPMATGGSTALPLSVYMNKHHAFSMLFTFFKCWYRMGWRPGDKILVFYPANTYNIDEMAQFNNFSWLSGFRIMLFSKIDEPTIRELIEEMNRYKPKMLLVFPSPMNMISDTVRKHDLPLKYQPPLINVSGETFFDCQRKNIESVFNESIVEDSYGSVELGEIAHETDGGLEGFSNVAYFENSEVEGADTPEMLITRLDLDVFPFIRYQMKDLAFIDFRRSDGVEEFLMRGIEGKDTNYILSHTSQRLYPSFFNNFVNVLNAQFKDDIIEVKVYERGQKELEVLFITRGEDQRDDIEGAAQSFLQDNIGGDMRYEIRFVDYIDHDYRRKYRVIERLNDEEFAGGIVGNDEKLAKIKASAE